MLGAINYINANNRTVDKLYTQMMTTKRINRAADDPVGSSIATKMESQIRGLASATKNATYAKDMLTVADEGFGRLADVLIEMKDIGMQLLSGTASTEDKAALEAQFTQLQSTYDNIVTNTKYNGKSLLDGSFNGTISTNADGSGMTINLSTSDGKSATLGTDSSSMDATSLTAADLTTLDTALDKVNQYRAKAGALANSLDFAINYNEKYKATLEDSQTRITNADMAKVSMEYNKAQSMQEYQAALLSSYMQTQGNILRILV